MAQKPILIVDDDPSILQMLAESLKSLGAAYQIFTATSSTEALDKIEEQSFAVIIADYMMPGITGIDLARAVLRLSPGTQVILMTAYGTSRLRSTVQFVGVDGYLNKPFTVDELHQVIQKTMQAGEQVQPPVEAEAIPDLSQAIREHLEELQVDTGARCVLLFSLEGEPIQQVGQINKLEVDSIGTFTAVTFQAAAKLADTLGSWSVFKSSYHEGDNHNLYAYDIKGQFLLAVVFEMKQRPGVVWFYTKQAVVSLTRLLDQSASG